MAGSRLTSGVTLDTVHKNTTLAVASAGIMDPSRVFTVMEDTTVLKEWMPAQNFITVRLPSLTWPHGNVFKGSVTTQVGALIVEGQTRVTLWLNNNQDMYGTARKLMTGATAAPPGGNRLLGSLVKLFWDQELMDAQPWVSGTQYGVTGDFVLMRPFDFISLELPPDSAKGPYPFRITWSVKFNWDLSGGG